MTDHGSLRYAINRLDRAERDREHDQRFEHQGDVRRDGPEQFFHLDSSPACVRQTLASSIRDYPDTGDECAKHDILVPFPAGTTARCFVRRDCRQGI
jgi:hypothetical protein